jgi:hypothetical protein
MNTVWIGFVTVVHYFAMIDAPKKSLSHVMFFQVCNFKKLTVLMVSVAIVKVSL